MRSACTMARWASASGVLRRFMPHYRSQRRLLQRYAGSADPAGATDRWPQRIRWRGRFAHCRVEQVQGRSWLGPRRRSSGRVPAFPRSAWPRKPGRCPMATKPCHVNTAASRRGPAISGRNLGWKPDPVRQGRRPCLHTPCEMSRELSSANLAVRGVEIARTSRILWRSHPRSARPHRLSGTEAKASGLGDAVAAKGGNHTASGALGMN